MSKNDKRNPFMRLMEWLDWDFYAGISCAVSIAIYILSPIFDYQNIKTRGITKVLNIYTSFAATQRAGLIFCILTFAFTLIDYIVDKVSYGAWINPKRKIVTLIIQSIATITFYIIVVLVNKDIITWFGR